LYALFEQLSEQHFVTVVLAINAFPQYSQVLGICKLLLISGAHYLLMVQNGALWCIISPINQLTKFGNKNTAFGNNCTTNIV
jgi:hypothetical protein